MHTFVTSSPDGVSLLVEESERYHRINFVPSYWKEGAIERLILSYEQRYIASIIVGPQLRLETRAQFNRKFGVGILTNEILTPDLYQWYLWVCTDNGGYDASINFTKDIKTVLRKVDRKLAKCNQEGKSGRKLQVPDPSAVLRGSSLINKDHQSLPKATGSGGYIYFIRTKGTKASPFLCKIGKTGDLRQRLPSLQTGSQDILEYAECVYVGRNVATVEHEIHLELKSLRAHGEWFSITEDQIKEICQWIETRKLSLEAPVVTACRAGDHTRQI